MDFKYNIGDKIGNNIIIDKTLLIKGNKKRKIYTLECLTCKTSKTYREDALKNISFISCQTCKNNWAFKVGEIVNDVKITNRFLKNYKNGYKAKCYEYECIKDGYVGSTTQQSLKKGQGCPLCAGRYIVKGINDMWTTAPWMAEMLYDKEDGYKYGKGSPQKVCFICPSCGEKTKPIKISDVCFHKKITCDSCRDTTSLGEKIIFNLLKELDINFDFQKSFEWSRKKRYDFYLPNNNLIIEFNGAQHYKEVEKFDITLEENQKNDILKKNLALKNGIKNYVIIEGIYSYPSYIINSIKNSELKNYLNLDSINWDLIVKNSLKSRVNNIISLWNAGKRDFLKISEEVGLKKETISKYLVQFTEMGLLNFPYIPKNYSLNKKQEIKEKYNIIDN